jgi:hypothetical protein
VVPSKEDRARDLMADRRLETVHFIRRKKLDTGKRASLLKVRLTAQQVEMASGPALDVNARDFTQLLSKRGVEVSACLSKEGKRLISATD